VCGDFSGWRPTTTFGLVARRTRPIDQRVAIVQRPLVDARWSCRAECCCDCWSRASSGSFAIVQAILLGRGLTRADQSFLDSIDALCRAFSLFSSTSKATRPCRRTTRDRRTRLTAATEPVAISSSIRCCKLLDISAHLSMIFCSHLNGRERDECWARVSPVYLCSSSFFSSYFFISSMLFVRAVIN
jgi:hypothetical protein